MEFRDVIKILRHEIGVTQLELATALHVSTLTVSRWELGKTRPNRAVLTLLLEYAYSHNVHQNTTDMLKESLLDLHRVTTKNGVFAGMMATEHTSLAECFDSFPFPVYVCDIDTYMILYSNKMALKMIGSNHEKIIKFKCYECLMHRNTPCDFCHKNQLTTDKFIPYKAIRDFDEKEYVVYGKLIRWNGHNAQIRFALSSDFKSDF